MIAVLAFVAMVVAVAAPMCGHHGCPWPLKRQTPPQGHEPTPGRASAPNRS